MLLRKFHPKMLNSLAAIEPLARISTKLSSYAQKQFCVIINFQVLTQKVNIFKTLKYWNQE